MSDDEDSVYSHPSMIDHSERVPDRIILSSTPQGNSGYGELPPQNLAVSGFASPLFLLFRPTIVRKLVVVGSRFLRWRKLTDSVYCLIKGPVVQSAF